MTVNGELIKTTFEHPFNASAEYADLRKVTPSQEIKDAVNTGEGKKIDPVYGYEVDRLEADKTAREAIAKAISERLGG